MRRRPLPRAALLAAAGLLCLSACNSDGFQTVYPVKGKVLVDGKPAHELMVTLHRTFDDPHHRKVMPYALTDENGEFQITSYVTNDGAPPGEYAVTFTWRERSGVMKNNFEGKDRLRGKYAEPEKSTHKITVEKQPNELPAFELTTK